MAGETIPTPRGNDAVSLYTWAQALVTVLTRRFTAGEDGSKSTAEALEEKAGLNQVTSGHWLFPFPEDGSNVVIGKAPQAFTITEVTTICTTGTCTVTVEINGTPLGGSANSASTSEQSQAHSSANEVEAGDTVEIVISSNSGCEGLTVDVAATIVLAL